MTCRDIIKAWLIANGYDGLYNEAGECGCRVDALYPDEGVTCISDCKPGYSRVNEYGDHIIGEVKP